MRNKIAFLGCIFFAVALCVACQATTTTQTPTDPNNTLEQSPIPVSPYMSVYGGGSSPALALNGNLLRMVGYQISPANVQNNCGWSTTQLTNTFTQLAASGANTARVWFLQSAGGPGNWAAFDQVVALAKNSGIVLVVTLVNQWGDCEPPYASTMSQKNYKTVAWYKGGYRQTNDGYPLSYRDYVHAVAARYASESTIALWQLVNEAEARDTNLGSCSDDNAAAQAVRAFADDMADVIHSVDLNHLVNLGTQDQGYCGVQGSNWQYVHSGKMDVCEVHTYAAPQPAMPDAALDKLKRCTGIGKPTFMGEMGFCQNVQPDGSCSGATSDSTLQRRMQFFEARFNAGFAAGLSGMLIWQWAPPGTYDTIYGIPPTDPVVSVVHRYR